METSQIKSVSEAKASLDAANVRLGKEVRKSLRAGKGPSQAQKEAYTIARKLWYEWCQALDSAKSAGVRHDAFYP